MSTFAQLLASATDGTIVVNSAKFKKTFQNNLNTSPKVPMIWDPADWQNITGLVQLNPTQFILPVGYYILLLMIEVFSPTSAKLQVRMNNEIAGVPQPESFYSGLTVATDFASTSSGVMLPVFTPGTLIEYFGEQSGSGGTLDVTSGEFNVIRLTSRINIPA